MDLASWHARLAQHFSQLREVRRDTRGDRPIFALEHGLEAAEVQAVAAAVRAHIAHAAPSTDHALAWIVYAAEIGYGFSGDEYWQTFEEQTPGWTLRGDRYWIRHCYRMFERKYGGVRPSGAWAEHFSIICWPITHAILPRGPAAPVRADPLRTPELILGRAFRIAAEARRVHRRQELERQLAAFRISRKRQIWSVRSPRLCCYRGSLARAA